MQKIISAKTQNQLDASPSLLLGGFLFLAAPSGWFFRSYRELFL
jgi:hypothetical protein